MAVSLFERNDDAVAYLMTALTIVAVAAAGFGSPVAAADSGVNEAVSGDVGLIASTAVGVGISAYSGSALGLAGTYVQWHIGLAAMAFSPEPVSTAAA